MTHTEPGPRDPTAATDPTVAYPPGTAPPPPGGWVAGPPPPPPGADPSVPVVGSRGPRARIHWSFGRGRLLPAADDLDRALWRYIPGESVWVLAAVAILVTYALAWVDAFLAALRHVAVPIPGQDRALALFAPGSIGYAGLLLLAVLVIDVGRFFGRRSSMERAALTSLAVASAVLVLAALARIIIELTYFGHGIDAALSGIVHDLVAVAIAVAAAIGAWRSRPHIPAELLG